MRTAQYFIKNNPLWVKRMMECSYHYSSSRPNLHHLEGNVWNHSKNSYVIATECNYSIYVKWAALLHDVGRLLTRKENAKKGSISFGDFEGVSIYLAVDILSKTDLSNAQKVRIFKIISFQYDIIDYVKYSELKMDEFVKRFKDETDLLKDLAQYVKCDFSARKIDKSKIRYYDMDRVDKFIQYTQSLESTSHPIVKKKDVVNILIGPPCSKKSSFSKEIASFNSIIINRDSCVEEIGKKYGKHNYDDAYHFMKENKNIKEEVDALDEERENVAKKSIDKNIIIDNPNLSIKSRKEWIDAFHKTHDVKVTLFLSGFEELMKCNKKREEAIQKTISKRELINKLKTFVFPLFSEGINAIEYKF